MQKMMSLGTYLLFFFLKFESPANYCISARFSQISAHFNRNMGTNGSPGNLRTRSSTSLPYQGDPLEVCCGSRLTLPILQSAGSCGKRSLAKVVWLEF